jgi:hypothetical protein
MLFSVIPNSFRDLDLVLHKHPHLPLSPTGERDRVREIFY